MTTTEATTDATRTLFRLPDPPKREYDEVTAHHFVYLPGIPVNLAVHFGRPETTLVVADQWIAAFPGSRPLLRPDLLIAFNVDSSQYWDQNGYVISDQGKPPDFVLEVASPSTAERDTGYKRVEYAAMGIAEYWRFDDTGESHGTRLAGDRLAGSRYEPMPITEVAPNVLEGHSEVLNLILRWEDGELIWIDPATAQPLPGLVSEREARIDAESRAQQAQVALQRAEARAEALEAELQRLRERKD